jgi:hypothetical protein
MPERPWTFGRQPWPPFTVILGIEDSFRTSEVGTHEVANTPLVKLFDEACLVPAVLSYYLLAIEPVCKFNQGRAVNGNIRLEALEFWVGASNSPLLDKLRQFHRRL